MKSKTYFFKKFIIADLILWTLFVFIGTRNHNNNSISHFVIDVVVFSLPWIIFDYFFNKTISPILMLIGTPLIVSISVLIRAVLLDSTFKISFFVVAATWSLIVFQSIRFAIVFFKSNEKH